MAKQLDDTDAINTKRHFYCEDCSGVQTKVEILIKSDERQWRAIDGIKEALKDAVVKIALLFGGASVLSTVAIIYFTHR